MKQTYWKFVGLCTGAMLLLSCTACGSKTEKGTVRIVEDNCRHLLACIAGGGFAGGQLPDR